MYLDTKHMRYIEAIARLGSVTKAAKELHMAQPPLSQQIQLIEKNLDFIIFNRVKRKLTLSREGELLIERIRPLLAQLNELNHFIDDITNAKTGDITIATLPSMVPLLSEGLSTIWNENTNIHINLIEGQSNEVIDFVQSRKAQIGITRLPIVSNNLDYSIIGSEVIRAFVNHDHPLSKNDIILPKELQDESLFLIKSNTNTSQSSFMQVYRVLEEEGIHPNVIGEMSSASAMLQFVGKGRGIGLAPRTGEYFSPSNVISIPFGESEIQIPTAIIVLKNESNPTTLFLKDVLHKALKFKN